MPSDKQREEHASERPVDVDEDNRPPGDPGPNVDIQEHVGGQPGRADPGVTGGPTHGEIGADEPASEPAPAPDAGSDVRAGATDDEAREPAGHAGGSAEALDEAREYERQFREKTEGKWPEREEG